MWLYVKDLKLAQIQGVEAEYKPTMAFDSGGADQALQIAISIASSVDAQLLAEWISGRLKKGSPNRLEINNQSINANNVVVIINNIQAQNKKPDTSQDEHT